eukprot:sb/3464375/
MSLNRGPTVWPWLVLQFSGSGSSTGRAFGFLGLKRCTLSSSFLYLSPPPHHVNPVRQLLDPINCFNHEERSGKKLYSTMEDTSEYDDHHEEPDCSASGTSLQIIKFIFSSNFLLLGLVSGCLGIIANVLSLIMNILLKERGLPSKLTYCLNVVDALVCLMAIIVYVQDDAIDIKYFDFTSFLLIRNSAMITCLLSVTRTISIGFPFYQISKMCVWIAFGVLSLVQVITVLLGLLTELEIAELLDYFNFQTIMLIEMIIILTTVTVATAISLGYLSSAGRLSNDQTLIKRATITIIIISIIYLFFNTILFTAYLEDMFDIFNSCGAVERFSLYVGSPLNSTINPLVILARKKKFTLQCVLKGNKPDFHGAMKSEESEKMYNKFCAAVRQAVPNSDTLVQGNFCHQSIGLTLDSGPIPCVVCSEHWPDRVTCRTRLLQGELWWYKWSPLIFQLFFVYNIILLFGLAAFANVLI